MKVVIAGAGVGGLVTALMLHARGIDCEIFEQADAVRELGVGINTLPHAIKELAALGLLARLDAVAIRTYELSCTNRFGQEIWREPGGLDAGYDVPQFSIHRGRPQGVLYQAVRARLGENHQHCDRLQNRLETTVARQSRATKTVIMCLIIDLSRRNRSAIAETSLSNCIIHRKFCIIRLPSAPKQIGITFADLSGDTACGEDWDEAPRLLEIDDGGRRWRRIAGCSGRVVAGQGAGASGNAADRLGKRSEQSRCPWRGHQRAGL
jgi:hypothetical protein